jgi:hypothetical protein
MTDIQNEEQKDRPKALGDDELDVVTAGEGGDKSVTVGGHKLDKECEHGHDCWRVLCQTSSGYAWRCAACAEGGIPHNLLSEVYTQNGPDAYTWVTITVSVSHGGH